MKTEHREKEKKKYPMYIRVCLWVKHIILKYCYKKKVGPASDFENESDGIDDDIDCDALEKKMMRSLAKEK